MANVLIGTVLKPQGIKGEVKVKVYTNDLNRFLRYRLFVIDGKDIKADTVRVDGHYAYVKFAGISSMNDAETLRDKDVFVKKDEMPSLSKGEYYIADLMECGVRFPNGEIFAHVIDVLIQAQSTVIIAQGEKKFSFPLLKEILNDVDVKNNVIELNEEKFNEVALIED